MDKLGTTCFRTTGGRTTGRTGSAVRAIAADHTAAPGHTGAIQVHRWAARAAPFVDGAVVAAAEFEPNVVMGHVGAGLAGLNAVFNWRRQDEAIRAGTGILPRSLIVVTTSEIAVFDGLLLRWWNVGTPQIRWRRGDVTARAVPIPGPYNPLRPTEPAPAQPALRISDRAGTTVAELRPYGWGPAHRRVFEVLTGHPGWPPTVAAAPTGSD